MQVWRVSRLGRASAAVLAVSFAGIGVLAGSDWVDDGQVDVAAILMTVAMPAMMVVAYRMAWWPRIALMADHVVIRNPVRKCAVPLNAIVALTTTPEGLDITTDQETVTAWAAQRGRVAYLLSRSTRADRIATELARAVDTAYRDEDRVPPRAIRRLLR